MSTAEIAAAAAKAPVAAIAQPVPWYVDRAWMQAARERMIQTVREFHKKNPLLPGIATQELARARAPSFVLDALLAEAKEIAVDGETVRSRTHKMVLKEDEEQARATIERAFEERRAGGAGDGGGAGEMRRGGGARTVAACRYCCGKSVWCGSARTWYFTRRRSANCASCWAGTRANAFAYRSSRSGPAFRASTQSHCWSCWTARELRAAKATNAWCCS